MNIFVLDQDFKKCAEYHCDRHCVKMILESAQLLCNVHRIYQKGSLPVFIYKSTHQNHPSSIWTRKSLSNYKWLCNLALALCDEYTYRYRKTHACCKIIEWCLENIPKDFKDVGLTDFALAMPAKYKVSDPVQSYRNYYLGEKQHLFKWTKREVPFWIKEKQNGV